MKVYSVYTSHTRVPVEVIDSEEQRSAIRVSLNGGVIIVQQDDDLVQITAEEARALIKVLRGKLKEQAEYEG